MGVCPVGDARHPASGVGTVGRCGGPCRARVPDRPRAHPFGATGFRRNPRAKRESVASGGDRRAHPARTHRPTGNRDASCHPNASSHPSASSHSYDWRGNVRARGLPVATDSPSGRKPRGCAHRTGSIRGRDALAGAGATGHLHTRGAPAGIEPPRGARRKRRWRLGCERSRRAVSVERVGSLADWGRRRGAPGAAAGSMRRTEPRPPLPRVQAEGEK